METMIAGIIQMKKALNLDAKLLQVLTHTVLIAEYYGQVHVCTKVYTIVSLSK